MGMSAGKAIRFGAFRADLRTGRLRKHGIRIKLGMQPFQILAALLERPGELVTREELRSRLWPENTFVEFDDSLNSAVKRLRDALGDSSRHPRYIKTAPGRGYQFIAPVEVVKSVPGPVPHEPEPAESVEPVAAVRVSIGRLSAIAAGVVIALGVATWLSVVDITPPIPGVEAGPVRFQARPLPGFPSGSVLSPDGRTIAFIRRHEEALVGTSQADIHVSANDGGPFTRVTNHPDREQNLSWSPEGLRIAFTRQGTAFGTYVVSLVDGSETLIGHHSPYRPSWTPDGKWLIGSYGRVFSMSLETREEKDLLPGDTNLNYTAVAVSPDGKNLAVSGCRRPGLTSCDLYVRPMEGGELRRLTFQNGAISELAWTPDSREIIYDLDGRMFRMPAAGGTRPSPLEFRDSDGVTGRVRSPSVARGHMTFIRYTEDADIWETDVSAEPGFLQSSRKLIDSPGVDRSPEYSPDGSKIAFYSDRPGGDRALWVANRDGSSPWQLTPSTFRVTDDWGSGPAWSPDGMQIAFRASSNLDSDFSIYTIPVEGGYPHRMLDTVNGSKPTWSRNGFDIFYKSSHNSPQEVFRVRSDGLGPGQPFNETFSWSYAESPDGEDLYYCGASGLRTGYGSLWRMPVEGGEKEEVRRRFSYSAIELREEGLYFLDPQDRKDSLVAIKLLDLETGRISEFARVRPSRELHFSISPDGRSVLTSSMDRGNTDLMLVEDFR